jgi:hypothetical protein
LSQWGVFAFAERGLLAGLFGGNRSAASLDEVFAAVRRCLESAPGISKLREET